MSSEEAEKESTKSNSDAEAHVTGFMVKSSKEKMLKKFDFVTEDRRHIYLSEEQINNQKKLEEEAKAKAAKQEEEVRKIELIDSVGPETATSLTSQVDELKTLFQKNFFSFQQRLNQLKLN
nr:hypothetical protein [Tanacetum cinerariifolium]